MRLHIISIAFALAISSCATFALYGPDKPVVDPAAVSALKEAHDMRDAFPTGFPGFSATPWTTIPGEFGISRASRSTTR